MKKIHALILGFLIIGFASCTDDRAVPSGHVSADVYYDFLAYPDFVDVDVEIVNTGNTTLSEASYEIELYGWEGQYLGSYRERTRLQLFPGESLRIPHEIWEYDVTDVYVRLTDVW